MYKEETYRICAESDPALRISMKQIQEYAVTQAVYENPNFQRYRVLRCRSTAFPGPTGTDKTSTIMNILSEIYIWSGIKTVDRAWKNENIHRSWYTNRTETTVEALFHILQRLLMQRILIVAPTNNAVVIIEERLLHDIPFLNA